MSRAERDVRPKAGPSIEDVARAAGVSIATVSRVLNRPELVAAATAERVRQAAQECGYRPNPFARALSTQRSGVLGLCLPDLHGEFYSEILRGADDEARLRHHRLLITSETHSSASADEFAVLPWSLMDGLVAMITEPNQALLEEATRTALPLCILDAEDEGIRADNVVIDNAAGVAAALDHLLRRVPPERCHFVGGHEQNFDTSRRAAAFKSCIDATGSRARDDQLAFGEYTSAWGSSWAQSAMSRGALRGAGVLAANDEIALGIMTAARDAGLVPPNDYLLVGFDDTRLCSIVRPTLTAVRVPLGEMGAAAVRMVLERIDNPQLAPRRVTLQPTLIERESA